MISPVRSPSSIFIFPIFCYHPTAGSVDFNLFWDPGVCFVLIEKAIWWNILVTVAHQPLQHFQSLHWVLGSVGFYKIRVLICRKRISMWGRTTGLKGRSSQVEPVDGAQSLKTSHQPLVNSGSGSFLKKDLSRLLMTFRSLHFWNGTREKCNYPTYVIKLLQV